MKEEDIYMPRYQIRENENYMFKNADSERKNLYYILTEIAVSESFLERHAEYFDDATRTEQTRIRRFLQEKINSIESKGGKTNRFDMEEMYGRAPSLWIMIIQTQNLSEAFIEKHIERFENRWSDICRYQKLSDDFMRKHVDKLSWWNVAYFQDYSEEFLLEFFDRIYEAVNHDKPEYTPVNGFLRIREPKNQELILLLKMRGLM
jgi:hypothetical protein